MDAFQNITVNSTFLDAEITSLEVYTEYELRIVGFTIIGDGNVSEPVFCFTDESGNNFFVPSLRNLRKQTTFGDATNRFLGEMTSEKQAQKFHTDDASLPRCK